MTARAWLEIEPRSRVRIGDTARVPVVAGATLGRSPENDLVAPSGTVARRHAQFLFHEGAWFIVDLVTTNGTTVNGVRARARTQIFHGDELTFAALVARFLERDEPTPLFAGVRRVGRWTLFNTMESPGGVLRHAIDDDGVVATASVEEPHPLRVPAAPRHVDAPAGGVRILEESAGVALAGVVDALRSRSDALEPSVAIAAALALARCHAERALPELRSEWLTFDGRVPVIARPFFRSRPVEVARASWQAQVVGLLAMRLGYRWNPNAVTGDDLLRGASALARDGVDDSTPIGRHVRALYDLGAQGGSAADLVLGLTTAQKEFGEPSREFVASLVADTCAHELAAERALVEQAQTLGAREIARRFAPAEVAANGGAS